MPKVSPPVGTPSIRQHGNVIDKIQAELAETKRREDELKRQRRDMFRSQPDLTSCHTSEESFDGNTEDNYDDDNGNSEVFTKYKGYENNYSIIFRRKTHHL